MVQKSLKTPLRNIRMAPNHTEMTAVHKFENNKQYVHDVQKLVKSGVPYICISYITVGAYFWIVPLLTSALSSIGRPEVRF